MGFLKKFFQTSNPNILEVVPKQQPKQQELSTLSLPIEPLPQQELLKPNKKVLAIETEAMSLGWTWGQLWQESRCPDLKGLATIIHKEQNITNVTHQYIQLERISPTGKLEIQRFYNQKVEQPWIKRNSP
jgi:hypothetical protein